MAGEYPDGNGLYLVVSKTGTKFWSFYYTLNGRQRQMGLGSVSLVSLAEARAKRDDCRRLLIQKIDPLDARKANDAKQMLAAARGMTFQQCAESYIKEYKGGWKNANHIRQWENSLPTYVYPIIGKLPVQDIDIGLILKVIKPIWDTKTHTANRVRGRIEAILDWASAMEYRQGENPARWRGKVAKLLKSPSKIAKEKHHPSLPYNQIGDFMELLKKQPGLDARALEFTILTAVRTNEVINASWKEFDLKKRIWTIPEKRMKTDKEHRVPLSDEAIQVIKQATKLGSHDVWKDGAWEKHVSGFVFPGRKKTKPISNMTMLQLLRRMNGGEKEKRWIDPKDGRQIVVHGFRATFRIWVAEKATQFPREVAEAALAHINGDKVEASYLHTDYFDRRRQLMDKWAKYCYTPSAKGVVEKQNVVPMKR